MSEEEREQFQSSNKCCISEKLIDDDDEKVRCHCHITGKSRGSAYWSCKSSIDWKSSSSISQFKRLRQSFNFLMSLKYLMWKLM